MKDIIEIPLSYYPPEGPDEHALPEQPKEVSDLVIAVRDHPEWAAEHLEDFPENPSQLQVHLVGTSTELEALGRYLIALARTETAEGEHYDSFDDVRNADGGTVRLIPRIVQRLPAKLDRSEDYCAGFRGEGRS